MHHRENRMTSAVFVQVCVCVFSQNQVCGALMHNDYGITSLLGQAKHVFDPQHRLQVPGVLHKVKSILPRSSRVSSSPWSGHH
jgi:hypothetical protein